VTAFLSIPEENGMSCWCVTDPSLPLAEVETELRRWSAFPVRAPWWLGWLHVVATVAGAIGGVVVARHVAGLHEWASLGAAALLGAGAAALLVALARGACPAPGSRAVSETVRKAVRDAAGVVAVPVELRTWAEQNDPPVPEGDLVELVRRLAEVRDAAESLDEWRSIVSGDTSPRAFALVDPIYQQNHASAQARYDEVAVRSGFELSGGSGAT